MLFLLSIKLQFYLVKQNGVNSSLPSGKDEGKLEPFSLTSHFLTNICQKAIFLFLFVQSRSRINSPAIFVI